MTSDHVLSPAADQVRRHDRDRFSAALFAPPQARERLMVLYAFNLELAKIRENVREAMAGMIRLQWWREVLNGGRAAEAARHPLAAPLLEVMRECAIPADPFDLILAARERDLQSVPFPDAEERGSYTFMTSGLLHEIGVRILGADDDASRSAAQFVGEAWASVGLLRSLPFHLSQGWLTLPEDLLAQAGLSADQVLAGKAPKADVLAIVRELARQAEWKLDQARKHRVPRAALPALLPAILASGHLARLKRLGWDVFDSRVALPRPMPVRLALGAALGRF